MNQTDKDWELINDLKEICGCYALGESCYDKVGDFTHTKGEECTE